MTEKRANQLPRAKGTKIKKGEESYRRMWEEVKPFVKKRQRKHYSTRGEWRVSGAEP